MQPIPFIAATAEEAVAQIRAKLGSEAVVLNVRRLPLNGLARLWQTPMIEVLAYRPEESMPTIEPEAAPISEAFAEFRQQLQDIKQQVERRPAKTEVQAPLTVPAPAPLPDEAVSLKNGNWRVGTMLQRCGLLPRYAQQVLDRLQAQYGENPPPSLNEEISLTQAVLATSWRASSPITGKSMHVLVGPAGCGKTTSLCKWLTQTVLMRGKSARVWRLDGATANTAESLSVYCEILGIPCGRHWDIVAASGDEEISFVDLPGVDWRNPLAVKELEGQLKQFGSPRIHLVLNGAYDVSLLLAQARAFAALPVEDLIITHLDEETRWGKVWNLVLGMNFSVRHFSTGQNIPGDFCEASPEMILGRLFSHK